MMHTSRNVIPAVCTSAFIYTDPENNPTAKYSVQRAVDVYLAI